MSATACLVILAILSFFFVTELLPLAVTAMSGAVAVGLAGFVPIWDIFSGLSNDMVVLMAGMLVVGAAMFHTGLAQRISEWVVRDVGKSENSLMFVCMGVGALMSSFLSNIGMTASLLPIVLGICSASKISPRRQLMPMAFGCGLGGVITVIGTPSNLIASGTLENAGLNGFGFFEFAWIGVPVTVAGILYMVLFGKRFLPTDGATGRGIDEDAAMAAQALTNDPRKMYAAAVVCIATLVMLAIGTGILPEHITAIVAVLLLVSGNCLTVGQAVESIDWDTVFLFAGMMPVATALDKSGASRFLADAMLGLMGEPTGSFAITSILFFLSCGLTQIMSNTASAAILCPLGISIAQEIGADPRAVLMVIAVGTSCAFATPVGTPPNMLVLAPGGYKFRDYVITGTPLILVCFLVSLLVIPRVWPLFP
jgi:anion transporter